MIESTTPPVPAPTEVPTGGAAGDDYPPNVLGASAIILSLTGVFFVGSFGIASLIGIGLGIGSLVRSRRSRHQVGGVGIVAIALGVVGLIVLVVVFSRFFATPAGPVTNS